MDSTFSLNFQKTDLKSLKQKLLTFATDALWIKDWLDFVEQVIDHPHEIRVQTSGSTGTPKTITYSLEQAKASAIRSLVFFGLKPGDEVGCPLSAKTIGGQMMFFRAYFGNLNIHFIEPKLNAFEFLKSEVKFIPCLVSQLQEVFSKNIPLNAKSILLGGSAIPGNLTEQLQNNTCTFYSSYGMTETLSHVAIRTLNTSNKTVHYKGLDGIRFSKNNDDCLVIAIPEQAEVITTTDIVELKNTNEFVVIGRADNYIITSGKKVNPEVLEKQLEPFIKGEFAISSIADEQFGQVLCLVLTTNTLLDETKWEVQNTAQASHLKIRKIIRIDSLPSVCNGKLDRKELTLLIQA